MNLKDKTILVLGLGVSGVSTVKALNKLGSKIIISDLKTEIQLKEYIDQLKGIDAKYVLGTNDLDLRDIDLVIKSPIVPLDVPILRKANEHGIEVITDLELAYRISSNKFIVITGTNGKTTTTTLIGEILKTCGKKCHVCGNIGVGVLWEVINSDQEDVFVIEASSFQLENTKAFKPKVSVIINITPDHITWHRSFEKYIEAKKKIFVNQDEHDFTILNYDDPILRELGNEINSKIIYFSQREILECGIYLKDDYVVYNNGKTIIPIINHNDIKIPGRHNLENVMAAISSCMAIDIDKEAIIKTLKSFKGVEHRLEYVDTINGINFYNDSKGTNPYSSIAALEAINEPIVLIAGGYDKGSQFEQFIKSFNGKVYSLILLGQTAEKIKTTAIDMGFNDIHIVKDMKEAVNKSFDISKKGYNVLLSPACASWGMYNNYEERGKDFKYLVENLRRLNNVQETS